MEETGGLVLDVEESSGLLLDVERLDMIQNRYDDSGVSDSSGTSTGDDGEAADKGHHD